MNREPCIICGSDALCNRVTADKYGKYFFLDALHKVAYKDLSDEKREIISNYVREHNKKTNAWAELGDIDELWKKIEKFNRNR